MNVFDSANFPTAEPSRLVVGDYWAWKRPDLATDYPTASYSLTYVARLESNPAAVITIAANGGSGEFIATVGKATTATYTPGRYRWTAYVTQTAGDQERAEIGSGYFDLVANLATDAEDRRTHAARTLENIRAVIENRATLDQQEYTIAGRSLKRMMVDELLTFRREYERLVKLEQDAELLRQGKGKARKIQVGFR